MKRVGVLALQGCVDPHLRHLSKIGATGVEVRSPKDLENINRLILPGGESTTMLKLLHSTGLYSAIIKFAQTQPVWGICAGAILLAREVTNPAQDSLGLIDIKAHRNFYGSQLDSFEADVSIEPLDKTMHVHFIRAPMLEALSNKVTVLSSYNGNPILLKEDRILASSFHSELGSDSALHQLFLDI